MSEYVRPPPTGIFPRQLNCPQSTHPPGLVFIPSYWPYYPLQSLPEQPAVRPSSPPTSTTLVPAPRSDRLVLFVGYSTMGKRRFTGVTLGWRNMSTSTRMCYRPGLNAPEAAVKARRTFVVGTPLFSVYLIPRYRQEYEPLTTGTQKIRTATVRHLRTTLDFADQYWVEYQCVLLEGVYELAWDNIITTTGRFGFQRMSRQALPSHSHSRSAAIRSYLWER